jgi:sec-independent protein translocase protein TatA
MFNLGLPEIIMIGAAALLVFGPKRLPELAKSLGKGIRDFKKALEGGGAEEAESEKLPPASQPEHSVTKTTESQSAEVEEKTGKKS